MGANSRRFSGTIAMPRPMRWLVERVVTSSPSNSMRPVWERTMPRIVFSVVDLPGGIAAQQADQLSCVHLDAEVLQDVDRPVVGVDALQLQEAHLVTAAFVPR